MLQLLARLHPFPFPSCWRAPHCPVLPKAHNLDQMFFSSSKLVQLLVRIHLSHFPCWVNPQPFIKLKMSDFAQKTANFAQTVWFFLYTVAACGKYTPPPCWAAPHPFIKSPDTTALPLLKGALVVVVGRRKNFAFLLKKYFFPILKWGMPSINTCGWVVSVRKMIGQRVVCWLLLLTSYIGLVALLTAPSPSIQIMLLAPEKPLADAEKIYWATYNNVSIYIQSPLHFTIEPGGTY